MPLHRRLRGAVTALPRDVIVLGIIAFCVAVGFGVLAPVLPVFAKTFGVGNFEVGAVISAFAVMRFATSPLVPKIIDKLGERTTLTVGVMIVAITSSGAGFAQTYPQLLVIRGLGGIGSAMFGVAAMTFLLATTAPALRGRAAAFYQGGFLLGGMAGPALGGLLAAISLTAPFHFYAITLAVAGVIGLLLLSPRSSQAESAEERHDARPFRDIIRDVRYRAACTSSLAQGWNSFGVRNSLVPVIVVEALGKPASWTAASFAVASIVQAICMAPAGRFVDTRGRRPAMVFAAGLGAAALIAIPFAPSIVWLTVVLAFYGIAQSFLATAPAAAVGDVTQGRGGRAVAVFSMCSDIGAIIGPLAAGALADQLGFPLAFAIGAALMAGASLYALRMPREARRTA